MNITIKWFIIMVLNEEIIIIIINLIYFNLINQYYLIKII
jgi:hypothetical protein